MPLFGWSDSNYAHYDLTRTVHGAEFSRLGDRGSLFTKEKLLDSQWFG